MLEWWHFQEARRISHETENILALLLALCLTFALCACGGKSSGSDNKAEETKAESSNETKAVSSNETKAVSSNETKAVSSNETTAGNPASQVATYVVTVLDADGNPVEGAAVTFSKESGDSRAYTDADGKLEMTGYIADYVVTVEGDDTEYTFEDGSYELTITLP